LYIKISGDKIETVTFWVRFSRLALVPGLLLTVYALPAPTGKNGCICLANEGIVIYLALLCYWKHCVNILITNDIIMAEIVWECM
jgi:hypothetical protein